MKQPCKHINEGSSCSLNNNCTYPECENVPSPGEIHKKLDSILKGVRSGNVSILAALDSIYNIRDEHTRLHIEAFIEHLKIQYPYGVTNFMDSSLSDYLTKNQLK